jgi:hypothetical protein
MFHTLRENTRTSIPYGQIYFDTETNFYENISGDTEHTLKLGVAIYVRYDKDLMVRNRVVKRFTEPSEFWDFVQAKIKSTRRVVIFAHNIFFDLWITQFYKQAFKDGWISRIPFTKGIMYIDKVKKDKLTIDLINVGNFFKSTVKAMGDLVGLPKLDVDFKNVSIKKLWIYCQRDAEILEKVMNGWFHFIKDNNLGNFGLTLPSQAFNAYRHRFMDQLIYMHRPGQPEQLERKSYKGGRVECFFIGKAPKDTYYKIDINSMYPYIMKNREFPYRCMYSLKNPDIRRLPKWLKNHCVVAEVDIETNDPVYPIHYDQKTIFPIGKFKAVLTTPSLKYAYDHNHIKSLGQVALYNKANLFSDYIDFFYTKRKKYQAEGNLIYRECCKVLMNSLYGKFGQKLRLQKTVPYYDNEIIKREMVIDSRDGSVKQVITFGGKIRTTEIKEVESFNSFCAIASHVTDYARMLLWKYMQRAPAKTLFYCDTDCLIVNQEGFEIYKNELDPTELGRFKIEDESSTLEIRGLKHYRMGKEWKRKGIRKQAVQLAENVFIMDIWPGFPLVFDRKLDQPYVVHKQIKKLSGLYTKGDVQENGWVTPIRLHSA